MSYHCERMNTIELGPGVYGFTHPDPAFGNSNSGLIIDSDGLTIVDSTTTPKHAEELFDEIKRITEPLDTRLKRVVLSSSRIPFSGGSSVYWQAAFYGSQATSDQLDLPPNPDAFRRLLPGLAEHFHDRYDTRPITHLVSEPSPIGSAAYGLTLPGESPVNIATYVESADVIFAGALGSFGVVPLAYDGDPLAWAKSLDQLAELAKTIVPGHGPVGGLADISDQADYLRACAAADGDPTNLRAGPWTEWSNQEFHAVNIERAARLRRGDDAVPDAMFALLGFEPEPGMG